MQNSSQKRESSFAAIVGWGGLGISAIVFAWYVGAPLIIGERWADKKSDAIQLVRDSKPQGTDTLYDMIRAFSLKAKEKDVFIGEFSWDAIQQDGPEYQVTLLWTERSARKVAMWRVNLKTNEIRPQGNDAAGLPQHLVGEPGAQP
jgi:hypothetical protein